MPVPDFSGINSSRHPVFKFLMEFTPDLFRCRNDKKARTREREMRLLVGATLCVVDRKRKIENRKL